MKSYGALHFTYIENYVLRNLRKYLLQNEKELKKSNKYFRLL